MSSRNVVDDSELAGLSEDQLKELAEFIDPDVSVCVCECVCVCVCVCMCVCVCVHKSKVIIPNTCTKTYLHVIHVHTCYRYEGVW